MAAFDRIKSGIPGLDQALDNIRLGDNVVWNVTNLNEFFCKLSLFLLFMEIKKTQYIVIIRLTKH